MAGFLTSTFCDLGGCWGVLSPVVVLHSQRMLELALRHRRRTGFTAEQRLYFTSSGSSLQVEVRSIARDGRVFSELLVVESAFGLHNKVWPRSPKTLV